MPAGAASRPVPPTTEVQPASTNAAQVPHSQARSDIRTRLGADQPVRASALRRHFSPAASRYRPRAVFVWSHMEVGTAFASAAAALIAICSYWPSGVLCRMEKYVQ